MARYKTIDTSPRFLAVDLERQLIPGTFVHALNHLIDNEIDLSGFDARRSNDSSGAPAWPPGVLLKVVLYAYSLGIVSSRGIERAKRKRREKIRAVFVRAVTTEEGFFYSFNGAFTALTCGRRAQRKRL